MVSSDQMIGGTSTSLSRLPRYPKEFELLLCCGGSLLRSTRGSRMQELVHEDLDWDLVIRLAHWHHMLPLLYWNLTLLEEPAPAGFMESLKRAYLQNVGRSLALTGELLAINDLLTEKGIVVVPYKGPVLAERLYGSIALRQYADLDIIVRKEDLETAREVLIERGYLAAEMVTGATHDFQVESRYSERFESPSTVVELHWAFTNKDVAFPLTLRELMPRLQEHALGGKRKMLVFSPEDTLLILCVHGAKHSWDRLEWICGVAEHVAKNVHMDWETLIDRAVETRSSKRLFLGLSLSLRLYDLALPDRVLGKIDGNGEVANLVDHVTSTFFDGKRVTVGTHAWGTIDHDLFQFKLADRLTDRIRYVLYRVTNPSRPERWFAISIGRRSVPVHVFTRPFGLIGRMFRAGLARRRR